MQNLSASIKNLLLAFCVSATAFSAQAQWVSIPDTNFGKWLSTNGYNMCLQGNSSVGWEMDTTCNEVVNANSVDCDSASISSIEGIQYFDSLKVLYCNYNPVTSLPVLPKSLTHLNCFGNLLTSLPALPNSLTYLICSYNQLTLLPALPGSLTNLECSDNHLISLPPLPDSLTYLDCGYNQLTLLPALPNSLAELLCYDNQLTSLPILPNYLSRLTCDNNQLTSLPDLPNNLIILFCSNNPLLSCLPKLGVVNNLIFSGTAISCLPNYPQENILSNPPLNSIPLCDVLNTNGCDVYYNISGTVYGDNISNCSRDVSEKTFDNIKVLLSRNGVIEQQTSSHGSYTLDTDFNTFEIHIDTTGLPYIVACPSTFFHTSTLTPQDSIDTDKDFGLRCKPGFDVGVLSAVRDSGMLFPAQQGGIHVTAGDLSEFYGLNCAAGVSGAVSITYSGTVSFAGVMSGALTPTVSGNTLTYTIADFGAIDMQTAFGLRFLVDTFAQIGQQLCLDVVVTPTAGDNNVSNNTATYCFEIVNSYDPNMKEVSPVNTILPYEDLTYTIHFQNMGNAPAIHIYVMDTLDNNLDESSIQILGSSHRMLTEIKGNIARFNFPNINLVDSITDKELSKGWLQYKIKMKASTIPFTYIKNTASIYFDFNAPVVTNTVTNTVAMPSAVKENRAQMSDISVFPNPTNDVVYIDYGNGVAAEVALYNMQGKLLNLTGFKNLQGLGSISLSGLPAGVYFISVEVEGNVVRKRVVKW